MGRMPLLIAWLAPALGFDHDRLAHIIDRLAAEYNTPQFEPHVTIVATSEVDEEAAARTLNSLVVGVPPFDVTFIAFGHEQTYFRALYLRAEPSAQLAILHEAAREAWALELPPYMPHLSLLY